MTAHSSDGLLVWFDEQVVGIGSHLSDAIRDGKSEAVHKLRVGTRRLKSVRDLAGPIVEGESLNDLNKLGKRLRRKLGTLRDHDVLIEHLRKLKPARGEQFAVKWLIETLQGERKQTHGKVGRKLDEGELHVEIERLAKEARIELATLAPAMPRVVVEALHDQMDRFADSASKLHSAEEPSAPLDPHALRILGKSLRYAMELSAAMGSGVGEEIVAHFKRMQDDLGLWHDWAVLGMKAQELAGTMELALHRMTLQRSVATLVGHAMRIAERHLHAFEAHWSRHGRTIQQSIRQTLPLTRTISQ